MGGKEPCIIYNLVSARSALCPQITSGLGTFVFLSAKVSWEPSKAIVTGSSLDYSSVRIASYLNTEPPAPQFFTPRAPIVLNLKCDHARVLLTIFPCPLHCLQEKLVTVLPPSLHPFLNCICCCDKWAPSQAGSHLLFQAQVWTLLCVGLGKELDILDKVCNISVSSSIKWE